MAKKVQVIVDVESSSVQISTDRTLTLTQQVRELRKALQTVPEGTKEWTLIQQKYNETKDALDRVNIKSKELFGTMSALPGPIGQVGGQLDSTVGTLKSFSKIKFSDIKSQFSELGKDLKDIGANVAKATGITTLYTTTTRATSQALQGMGVSIGTANTAAKLFAGTLATLTAATGIILVTAIISQLSNAYEYFAGQAERAAEAQKKFNEQFQKENEAQLEGEAAYIKREGDLDVARVKAKGGTAKDIYDKEQFWRDLTVASKQRYYDSITNKDSDEARKALADLKSAQNDIKVAEANFQADRLEKAKANAEAIKKYVEETRQGDLTARDRELAQAKAAYDEIYKEAVKNGNGTSELIEAYRKKRAQINKKYDDLELTAQYKLKQDLLSDLDLELKAYQNIETHALDLRHAQNLISEGEYQEQLYQLKLKYATSDEERQQIEIEHLNLQKQNRLKSLDDDIMLLEAQQKTLLQGTQAYLDNSLALENAAYKKKVENAKGNAKQLKAVEIEHEKNIKDIKLQAYIAEKQIALDRIAVFGMIGNSLGELAGKNKELAIAAIVVSKAAAIGEIIVNTQIANAKAVAASPLTLGQPWVTINYIAMGLGIAASIASAAKAISEINSVQTPSSGTTTAGVGGGGGEQAPTPAFNGSVSVPAPQIGASQASSSGNLGTIIGNAIQDNNSTTRPIRAYVVGDQVTTQQQLDRRISVAAKMGG
jgi:hypothetical protein